MVPTEGRVAKPERRWGCRCVILKYEQLLCAVPFLPWKQQNRHEKVLTSITTSLFIMDIYVPKTPLVILTAIITSYNKQNW